MQEQNSMDVIRVKCKANPSQPIPLLEFLNDPLPFDLTQEELNVREALRFLYDENEKKPPLFGSFPDWRKNQPLIIDCTTLPKDEETNAEYTHENNMVIFKKSLSPVSLIGCLAHELMHAKQWGKHVHNIRMGNIPVDNLAIQQVGLIGETLAYIFENYVRMLFFQKNGPLSDKDLAAKMEETSDLGTSVILNKMIEWSKEQLQIDPINGLRKNYKELEKALIPAMLDKLYESSYQKDYERNCPAHSTDKGLTSLPREFDLDEEYAHQLLQGKLQEMPKDTLNIDDYLNASEQERSQILRRILSQVYKNSGNGLLDETQYSSLIRCSYQDGDMEGMVALLKKRNKQGDAWVDIESKMDALYFLINTRPMDEAIQMIKDAQNESPAFNANELSEILKDRRFNAPQIQAALKQRTDDKGLKQELLKCKEGKTENTPTPEQYSVALSNDLTDKKNTLPNLSGDILSQKQCPR